MDSNKQTNNQPDKDVSFEIDRRIITTSALEEDNEIEKEYSLRPSKMEDYVGQDKVKKHMEIYITAAKQREEALDHVLLYGPPGLGKTTLSNIIAHEMGVNIKTTSGPAIERPGDMAAILNDLHDGDILFIDEIHRINKIIEEVLYPAMEDFAYDIMIGKGPSAKSVRLTLPKFTLIGATTRVGLLSAPLRDRFGMVERLEPYSPEDLAIIVTRSAKILDVPIEETGAFEIAKRSRGTPRVANRLLKRVRDFTQVKFDGFITKEAAMHTLDALEVDKKGLDSQDREVLLAIIEKYAGGPVGLDTIGVSIDEDPLTIEDVIEPYLIQLGFIKRTPRGRVATQKAYEYLDIPYDTQT